MKYLGIDYGERKVGVAISDEGARYAFPHRVLKNDHVLIKELTALIQREHISEVVVGDSTDHQGGENPVMKGVRSFVEQLTRHTGVLVHYEPERYTTQEARRGEPGAMLDASAAALILQGFLDRKEGTQ